MSPNAEDALSGPKCVEGKKNLRPLLVEWPAADRAMLEASTSSGVVAVRYTGCELEVLSRCTLEGVYEYRGLTRKRDEVRIKDAASLYTELPVGAVRLETALSKEGQINIDMAVVGRLEASANHAKPTEGSTGCGGATHLVSGITVGAFQMYTGTAVSAGAGVGVGNIGAGGEVARSTEFLRRDGEFGLCEEASSSDAQAPEQCGALLRVELAPIEADGSLGFASAQDEADEAQRWDKEARKWHGIRTGTLAGAAVFGAGALVGLVFYGVRTGQVVGLEGENKGVRDDAEFFDRSLTEAEVEAIERRETEISDFKDQRRPAAIAGIALGVAAGALLAVSIVARKRSDEAANKGSQSEKKTAFAPLLGPGFAGLGVSGRF